MKIWRVLTLIVSIFSVNLVFVQSANASITATTISTIDYPNNMVDDADGNLFIVNDHSSNYPIGIIVIPAITGTLFGQSVTAGMPSTLVSMSVPAGLAFSPTGTLMWSLQNGYIYALASTSRNVFGVSVAANTPTLIFTGTELSTSIDFDSAGNLYGIFQTPGVISVIPVATGTLFGQSVTANTPKRLFSDSGHWFWDLATDSSGNIYVTDGFGTVDGGGVFVLPRATGTLYGQSVTANTFTRLTAFTSAVYAGIDVDASGVLFVQPYYGGSTYVLSSVDTNFFNVSVTANTLATINTSGYSWSGLAVTRTGALLLGGFMATYKLVYAPDLTVPGIPGIGTVTALSPTSASISFTAPASDGGATIETYTATSTPGFLSGRVRQSSSGSITITGLTASTAYTFTVTASNSVGTSSASSATASITMPASQAEIDAATLAAKKAAEAKREAEKQAARREILKGFAESKLPTIQQFNTAEISGVTEKNYPSVTKELLALPQSERSDIFVVEKIAKKYKILDEICKGDSFRVITPQDLSSVGLIPVEHKTAITYVLRQLPAADRDNYSTITSAINEQLAVIERRKERLAVVIALINSHRTA